MMKAKVFGNEIDRSTSQNYYRYVNITFRNNYNLYSMTIWLNLNFVMRSAYRDGETTNHKFRTALFFFIYVTEV